MNHRIIELSDGPHRGRVAVAARTRPDGTARREGAVEIRPLRDEDLLHLATRLRDMDRIEVHSLMPDRSIAEALLFSGRASIRSCSGFWKGDLVACWGIVPMQPGSTEGTPWLLATDAIDTPEVQRAFIRHGAEQLRRLSGGFHRLWNLVHRENAISIRWLRFMGFEFRDPREYVFSGEPFVRFEMELC
jgi:hypothetical protein